MAKVIHNLVSPQQIHELLDYMSVRDHRSDVRPDVVSKHPRWHQDQWPQHTVQEVLDQVLPYDYRVEEVVFNESRISFRLHADSGDGDLDRLGHAVLIPLLVQGQGATVFFDNHWHGASTKFSRVEILPFEYDIPTVSGEVYHVPDLRQLLHDIQAGLVPSQLADMENLESTVQDLIAARQNQKLSKMDARTANYQDVINYREDLRMDLQFWQAHLSHVPWENFHGLTVEQVIAWNPGDVIVFERTQLHAAAAGHDRKIGVTVFTQRR
jgi:hypothetical protein